MSFEHFKFPDPGKENSQNQKEEQEKTEKIEKAKKEVEEMADYEGKGLDQGVKDVITSFRVMEISTSGSCEGHPWKGSISAPWIEIGSTEEPKERFVGENEIFQRVADKRNLSFEEVKRSHVPDAYWEAMKEASKNDETKEYLQWEAQNQKEFGKVKALIEEFYSLKGEPENPDVKIADDAAFRRIYSGGKDYEILEKDPSEEEKRLLEERLEEYRAELKRFADFLLEKYLGKKTG